MIEKNRKIKAVCSCLGDMLLIFAAYLLANYLRFNYIRFFQEGGAGPALDIAQDARTLAAEQKQQENEQQKSEKRDSFSSRIDELEQNDLQIASASTQ